jgi:hypothetical protein
LDDSVGQARLTVWNQQWINTPFPGNDYWDGDDSIGWYIYFYSYPDASIGIRFQVNEPILVTELAGWRFWSSYRHYLPDYIHNIRIWDTVSQLPVVTAMGPFFPPANSWQWYNVVDTWIGPGEYVLAMYAHTQNHYPHYYVTGDYFPGVTPDGVLEPLAVYRHNGAGYPNIYRNTGYGPFIDLMYTRFELTRDTVTCTAGTWVENVDPELQDAVVDPLVGQEGSEVTVTAKFSDPGTEDTWKARVCWGDAPYPEDCEEWADVIKYSGGAKILFLHSWTYDVGDIMANLAAELGDFAVAIDEFDWGPIGEDEAPPLELLQQYDVVIAAENYISDPGTRDDLGDVLADYSDGGGNVVPMWVSDMDDYFYGEGGIMGRWRDDGYHIFEPDNLYFGWSNLGAVFNPEFFSGVGGVSTYFSYWSPSVTPGTTLHAQFTDGRPFVGAKWNHVNGMGRTCGIAMFPTEFDNTGDYMTLMANVVKICSQQPEPAPLPMPIQLQTWSHIYKDDHPDHVTPSDTFNVRLEIVDDDHERCALNCAEYVVINEAYLGATDWLELYNFGANAVNLLNWEVLFYDNRGYTPNLYTFGDFTLPAGGSVQMLEYSGTDDADTVYTGFNIWWVDYTPYGGGAVLMPTAASGFPCDFVRWNSGFTMPGCAWGPPDFNQDDTVYRAVDEDTDTGNDWATDAGTGTPNAVNPGQTGNWPQPPGAVLMHGADEIEVEVVIENVFPEAVIPTNPFVGIVNEMSTISFDGFTISDPAMKEKTESFWWRWNFDDGTAMTPWEETGQIIPGAVGGNVMVTGVPLDFPIVFGISQDGAQQLFHNFLIASMPDGEGDILMSDTSWFMIPSDEGAFEATMNGNFGTNWDFIYDASGTELMDAGGNRLYDALYLSYDWAYYGVFYTATEIGDFVDAGGHVIVPGDEFNYGELDFLPWFVEYSNVDLWTQFPGPAFDPCPLNVATSNCTTQSTTTTQIISHRALQTQTQ